jgi:hypothetical protein
MQIMLAALSTGGYVGSIISSEPLAIWIGGISSICLLALSLYFKDFDPSKQMTDHRKAIDDLWLIREQYVSLLTDFSILTNPDIITKRDKLQNRIYELYKSVPKTDSRSYKAAQRAIKFENEQYFSTEEIDKLLPPHLRVCENNEGK